MLLMIYRPNVSSTKSKAPPSNGFKVIVIKPDPNGLGNTPTLIYSNFTPPPTLSALSAHDGLRFYQTLGTCLWLRIGREQFGEGEIDGIFPKTFKPVV